MSQPDSLSWWDDIKAGSIAGIVMVLCSHPFEYDFLNKIHLKYC